MGIQNIVKFEKNEKALRHNKNNLKFQNNFKFLKTEALLKANQ